MFFDSTLLDPLFLASIALKSTVILACGITAVALFCKTPAAMQHAVVVTTQLAALGAVVFSVAVPKIGIIPLFPRLALLETESSVVREDIDAGNPFHLHSSSTRAEIVPNVEIPAELPISESVRNESKNSATDQPHGDNEQRWLLHQLVFFGWMLGTVFMLSRLMAGFARLRSLQTRCEIATDRRLVRRLRHLASDHGITGCQLLVTHEQVSPMTWGIWRPVVVLPKNVTNAPAKMLNAILQHELAHVARRDALSQLIGGICVAIFWLNPLSWLIQRRSVELAEKACDDRVLSGRIRPSDYAASLLFITRDTQSNINPRCAINMAKRSLMRKRIEAILNESTNRTTPSRPLLATFFVVGVGVSLPYSFAQQSNDPRETVEVVSASVDDTNPIANGPVSPLEINWKNRRLDGYTYIRGRVVSAPGKPVAHADVGVRWEVDQGHMQPIGFATTDRDGRFELPITFGRDTVALMAIDASRRYGGLTIVNKPGDDVEGNVLRQQNQTFIDVEIRLQPLAEIQGSYATPRFGRPKSVWTSVVLPHNGITILETKTKAPPFFSLRLPPGKYQLRGNAAQFEDVYREIDLKPGQSLMLNDLPMTVAKLASLYGRKAPPWDFTDGQNIQTTVTSGDYRGKWIVLEFWGAWCGPCIRQMDQLFMFSERHAKDREKYEIITIHHDREDPDILPASMPKLLKRWERDSFPYPIAFDSTNKIFEAYGIQSYPTTVFIDPNGRIQPLPGIWGLSDVLKGGEIPEIRLFATGRELKKSPRKIRPTYSQDAITCNHFVTFNGHQDVVAGVRFLPNGREFATASSDVGIRIWDIDSRQQTQLIRCTDQGRSFTSYGGIQVFVPNANFVGGRFFARRKGRNVPFPRLWRVDSNYSNSVSVRDDEIYFGKAAISPDATKVAAYAYHEGVGEEVRIYDIATQKILHKLDVHGKFVQDSGTSSAIEFSPDGYSLVISGEKGKAIQLWDVNTGKKKWQARPSDAFGVNSISFFPDGKKFAYATWHAPLEIREAATGRLVQTLQAPGYRHINVRISKSGKYAATSGYPTARIWDLSTGKTTGILPGHPTGTRIEDLDWSNDDRYIATVGGNMHQPGEILLWDLRACGIVGSQYQE